MGRNKKTNETEPMVEQKEEKITTSLPKVENWVSIDNQNYFFSYKSVNSLPTGLYNITINGEEEYGLSKMDTNNEDLIKLPSFPYEKIISELKNFWNSKEKFIKYKLNPQRGIIISGEPGYGKTSLIKIILDELKEQNGIAILFQDPESWVQIAKYVRQIEKDRPIICIIEDFDLLISKYGDDMFLSIIDGVYSIYDIVYIATVNNLEYVPNNIKNRPSCFDITYELPLPKKADREQYFKTKIQGDDRDKYDISKLVKDTNDFSMAHLKEVFISLYLLDKDYDIVINQLRSVKLSDKIGFNIVDSE